MTKGPLIIVSGPSGVGKSTLIHRVLETSGLPLRLSVSVTTRELRSTETEGADYYRWERARFEREMDGGAFLEHAQVVGNYYGTLRSEVEPYRHQGMGVLLDIDVQGFQQVRQQCPDAVSIFVRPSSMDVLAERLWKRGTESAAAIEKRLIRAQEELRHAQEYAHQIVNDDLETALASFLEILRRVFAV
jgi:guanylate kinase